MNPYDNIDDYVANRLSGEERTAFENALQEDESLRSIVANYTPLKNVSKGILELELLEEVKKVSESSKAKVVKINPWKKYRWVGAAAIIAGLAFAFFNYQSNLNQQELISSYYQEYDEIERSGGTDQKDNFKKAKSLFSTNYFEDARELLEKLIAQGAANQDLSSMHELLGHVYFELKDFEKAEINFSKNKTSPDACNIKLCQVLQKKASAEELQASCAK